LLPLRCGGHGPPRRAGRAAELARSKGRDLSEDPQAIELRALDVSARAALAPAADGASRRSGRFEIIAPIDTLWPGLGAARDAATVLALVQ
jgi:hypothetical protein